LEQAVLLGSADCGAGFGTSNISRAKGEEGIRPLGIGGRHPNGGLLDEFFWINSGGLIVLDEF
jgi:hypothetical protein